VKGNLSLAIMFQYNNSLSDTLNICEKYFKISWFVRGLLRQNGMAAFIGGIVGDILYETLICNTRRRVTRV